MMERVSKLGPTAAVGAIKSTGARAQSPNASSHAVTGKSLPKLIELARALTEQGPPVDYAKIAQIRQAIAQGEYHIDTEAIASAILRYGASANSDD